MPVEEPSAVYEMAHVLFMDIVGYSLQPIDRQTELVKLLQQIVRESAEFRQAREQGGQISLPTGDGMALVFFGNPLSPVKCALEIAASLKQHAELRLRMGIHTGPVQRHADIREGINVTGGGINTAQRVMDCGDAGHILLSRNVAEVLEQLSAWRDCLQDFGSHEVKHGVVVHLYNLRKGRLGNPKLPGKLKVKAGDPAAKTTDNVGQLSVYRRLFMSLGVFAVACMMTAGLDGWLDKGIKSGESNGLNQLALTFSGLYQRIAATPRDPMPRYTAVIEIDPERDPGSIGLHDICGQRKMMTALLRKVAAAMPSVIVIDKYFGQGVCSEDVNAPLALAMSDVGAQLPVVLGQRVIEDGLYLLPSFQFPGTHEAIVNIDPDTRRLPLKWQVYSAKSDMDQNKTPIWRETLAFKAADAYERGKLLDRHPRLAKLLDAMQHPYISFLEIGQFKQFRFPAGFVLCGREVKPGENAAACAGWANELKALSGKVVLIGEINRDEDEHSTVIGRIPGVYLQANFIEALLDDRYFAEPTPAVNFTLGFGFLVCLEIILAMFYESWLKRTILMAVLALATVALLYFIISNLHWYLNPFPFLALAILLRTLAPKLIFRPGAQSGTKASWVGAR
jgi:class 3 adenylate cyclase/CHASE2 domain-containing sensor protein